MPPTELYACLSSLMEHYLASRSIPEDQREFETLEIHTSRIHTLNTLTDSISEVLKFRYFKNIFSGGTRCVEGSSAPLLDFLGLTDNSRGSSVATIRLFVVPHANLESYMQTRSDHAARYAITYKFFEFLSSQPYLLSKHTASPERVSSH
ncbi:hypothetical protein HZB02_00655 [Candidatus Woesearchaeota archaeon]|nr:hypothetical protein [Candidatus Woesearchaeota archaeon]